MLANFLIGLREGLEASLIVGILIAFAVRSNRRHVIPVIWGGVAAAIALSAATGAFLLFGLGEAGEAFEPILSGALSVLAAGLITWMVFWMAKTARNLKSSLEGNLENSFGRNSFAVALVAFFAVAREGVETALFMWASVKASGESVAATAVVILGILVATGLGWLFYRGALTLNLRVFFQWTGAAIPRGWASARNRGRLRRVRHPRERHHCRLASLWSVQLPGESHRAGNCGVVRLRSAGHDDICSRAHPRSATITRQGVTFARR
jgi:high-affinity iron transporter